MKARLQRYRALPMLVVMGTIFFLSSIPGDKLPLPSIYQIDKLAHLMAYGTLAATILIAHKWQTRLQFPARVVFLTIVGALFYGVTDEFHQAFVPGRCVSGGDLLADTLGAALVACLWYFGLRRWWTRR